MYSESILARQYVLVQDALAPGTSEEIQVQFRPTEWRYYYDCIRVHCQACTV